MKTKITILRNMLKQLPETQYANCIAGNSTIKYIPFKGYAIFAGGIEPYRFGTFEEIRDMIQQEIDFNNYLLTI